MSKWRESVITELPIPDPYTITSVADLDVDLRRAFRLLAEADVELVDDDRLDERAVLEKLEIMHEHGQVYVEREPETRLIRGALHGAPAHGGERYDIELLAVDKTYRRRGIGRELLRQAERTARRFGASVLSLQAIDEPQVTRFYIGEGFQPVPWATSRYVPMTKSL